MAVNVRHGRRHPSVNEEAEMHSEGAAARRIEHYTAQVPSECVLVGGGGTRGP